MKTVTFSCALDAVKNGFSIQRTGWNGKGLFVKLFSVENPMTLPFLYIEYPEDDKNNPGARVPWVASQTDILAEDWLIEPNDLF